MRSIEWQDGNVVVIDQTRLPGVQEQRVLRTTEEIAEAIRSLRVRGAPALGIAGAMGVAQAALHPKSSSAKAILARAEAAGAALAVIRPTAVNLSWGIERVLAVGRALTASAGPVRMVQAMVEEALAIQDEDERACHAMAKHALEFFSPKAVVLTHCNTGFLCTGGYGTALGAIRAAHENGLDIAVLATETRPLLQGSRLTAWELQRLEIPHAVLVDAAAPGLIARGEVSLVVVGADRIAANGDVVNKVGTYPLALAANAAGIPFVVVAPTSTIDLGTRDGNAIEVEERSPAEVTTVLGTLPVTPYGTRAVNPAFDVTPAALVTAIVTEHGVARAPFERSLPGMLGKGSLRLSSGGARAPKKPKPTAKPRAVKPVAKPRAARAASGVSKPRTAKRAASAAKSPARGKKSAARVIGKAKRAR